MAWINKILIAAAAVTATLGVTESAEAQRLNHSNAPNYGTRSASPGFTPDPMVINVTSGGNLQVSAMGLGAGCTGFATEAPDFRFNLQGGSSSFLRFFVEAAGMDTTLIINDPRGNWHCNDDSASGNLNPMVDFQNAPPGQYDVWIGSYRANERARGTLNITELSSRSPGGGGGGGGTVGGGGGGGALNLSGNPAFGSTSLTPGFTPDPHTVRITSGGSINAANAGLPAGCLGSVAASPDYNVTLSGNSNFLRFFVNNNNGADTTLIINGPNGQWYCNDDSASGNVNPMVDFNGAAPGLYNVWIGSYRQGTNAQVTLNVTELQSHRP